jgi:mono/diheme cytochrome c family protein
MRKPALRLAALCSVLAAGATAAEGQTSASTHPDSGGFYSAEQAERGEESFRGTCRECHTASEFRGSDFEWQWRRQNAWNLFNEISWTMPEDAPGSLTDQTYADVVAYILQLNKYPAGGDELEATQESMGSVPLGPDANKTKPKPTGSP